MTAPLVIGIDVGAAKKGFHALALRGSELSAPFHAKAATELARWCIDQQPAVIAIDAPCHWREAHGPARLAERALAQDRISCFSTPTEEKARGHSFYTWMHAGHALYSALADHYPIYTSDARRSHVAIETFPQAVACALAGRHVSARQKLPLRRALLRDAGLDPTSLRTIDEVDAALCALAARHFATHTAKLYGDAPTGFIIVPSSPLPAPFHFLREISPAASV